MGFKCPRCGLPVKRKYSDKALKGFGFVGLLFYWMFAPFQCEDCGKIPKEEFSSAERTKMVLHSLFFFLGAVAIVILLIVLLAVIEW